MNLDHTEFETLCAIRDAGYNGLKIDGASVISLASKDLIVAREGHYHITCRGIGELRPRPFVYTMDTCSQFARDKQSGDMLEVDKELWYYFLEVLPPIHMGYKATVRNAAGDGDMTIHASFGFAEGYEYVTAFWCGTGEAKGRYFAQLTKEMNPYG